MALAMTPKLLKAEAERRGRKYEAFGADKKHYYRITLPDGRHEIFRSIRPMRSAANGVVIAQHKDLTMSFIKMLGYGVPEFIVTDDTTEAIEFMRRTGVVVVKPVKGERSQGVSLDITTPEKMVVAMGAALNYGNATIVQRQLYGNVYRLLIVNGKMVAAVQRRPAMVVGDGTTTLRGLIGLLNSDPRRMDSEDNSHMQVNLIDAERYLGDRLQTVPATGERVRVSAVESISAGGDAVNVTDHVHPEWQYVAGSIATEAGLFVCGLDVMVDDIAAIPKDNKWPILEMNSMPGLRAHEFPTEGEPIHVIPLLFDELFGSDPPALQT